MELDKFTLACLVAGGIAVSVVLTSMASPSPFTIFDKFDICANLIVGNTRGAAETAFLRLQKTLAGVFPGVANKQKEFKLGDQIQNLGWGETFNPSHAYKRIGACYMIAFEDFESVKKSIVESVVPGIDALDNE